MKKFAIFAIILFITMSVVGPICAMSGGTPYDSTEAKIVVDGHLLSLERHPVAINERTLVPARTTFGTLGATVDWYPNIGKVDIKRDGTTISMTIGNSTAKVNGVEKKMDTYPILVRGTVMAPLRYVAECFGFPVGWDGKEKLVYIGRNLGQAKPDRGDEVRENWGKYKVVVDAGHGGRDPGAVYKGVQEKDLNLDIAKRLEKLLKEQGIQVYMTRTDDSFVNLHDRSALANNVNADLFASIHNNAGMTSYSGSITLYYPSSVIHGQSTTSKDIANIVQNELSGKLGSLNLGIQPRPNLVVLNSTKMPAFIAEVGFITNGKEMAKLNTATYRQNSAEALKNAILKVLKKIK